MPGWSLTEGQILERGITEMHSVVVEPMQNGRLFLAGDAAHIVPPTGAKGLNLAAHDVTVLAEALRSWYDTGSADGLAACTRRCLRRVWRAQDFSLWMTELLHRYDLAGQGPDEHSDAAYRRKVQLSRLQYVAGSAAAARSLAENYVGLPFDP